MMFIDIKALSFIGLGIGLFGTAPSAGRVAPTPVARPDSVVLTGDFSRFDRDHWARGTATIVRTETGALAVAFGDTFESGPGPDLRVVLSENAAPARGQDLGDYIELGRLTQIDGAQRFGLPEAVDLGTVRSVVIYCKRFDVLFSVASLSAPDA